MRTLRSDEMMAISRHSKVSHPHGPLYATIAEIRYLARMENRLNHVSLKVAWKTPTPFIRLWLVSLLNGKVQRMHAFHCVESRLQTQGQEYMEIHSFLARRSHIQAGVCNECPESLISHMPNIPRQQCKKARMSLQSRIVCLANTCMPPPYGPIGFSSIFPPRITPFPRTRKSEILSLY